MNGEDDSSRFGSMHIYALGVQRINIDTSGNDVNIQPQHVLMERTISDITTLLQKRFDTSQPTVVLFQWQEHNDQQCKVNTVHMYVM